MFDLIDSLKVLFFGSIENWNNYLVSTNQVGEFTEPNWIEYFIKYSPHIITITFTFFFFAILLYIIYRLLRLITK